MVVSVASEGGDRTVPHALEYPGNLSTIFTVNGQIIGQSWGRGINIAVIDRISATLITSKVSY